MQASKLETTAQGWKTFYKFGGLAALSMVAIIVIQMIFFMTAPPPLEGSARDWFDFFQTNRLAGLVGFELLMIVYTLLSLPVALCLYRALKRTDAAWTAFYVVLTLIGVVCFIAARPALEMLSLSSQFQAAATETERSIILAAGEAKLAAFHGTAFQISYILGSLGGLILSFVMLKSNVFSRATAYVRIGSSIFDFGLYLPGIGMYISIFSVFFLFAFNIMVARRFFQLARAED
jgi:hypothetical protein